MKNLPLRRFIGSWLSFLLAPSSGQCGHCDWPWKFTKYHITNYSWKSGCFPLCEKCWFELKTPEARMPFYRDLANSWLRSSPLDYEKIKVGWVEIQKAVMEGK